MFALLKLIPLKDWLYGGAIVALLLGFGLYTIHERHVGEAKITAQDAALAAAQVVHNQEVQNAAQKLTDKALSDYQDRELQPVHVPVTLTHLVCNTTGANPVPDHGSAPGPGNGASGVPAASGQPFDPAEQLLEDGRDADSQITLLQDYIRACQAKGLCAK